MQTADLVSEKPMHTRRRTAQVNAAQLSTAQLKDEVYRQMFRLEENRRGADLALALALLRAWIAADDKPRDVEDRDWLRKVSPICLQMIEAAARANASIACAQ
jgi:hypothetical protein